jgi:hypothetical protein
LSNGGKFICFLIPTKKYLNFMKINRKNLIGILAISLGVSGVFAAESSYAMGPFGMFNHMYNSELAVGGALAGLAGWSHRRPL